MYPTCFIYNLRFVFCNSKMNSKTDVADKILVANDVDGNSGHIYYQHIMFATRILFIVANSLPKG